MFGKRRVIPAFLCSLLFQQTHRHPLHYESGETCLALAWPSGTEDIYKIYAGSFQAEDHLDAIVSEARRLSDRALESAA